MSDDLVNLSLSRRASFVAEQLFSSGYFSDKISIVKFGLAYSINHYYGKFDPSTIDREADNDGLNYNVGSLDGDKSILELVRCLYPECIQPYRYARGIVCFGLDKLGVLFDRSELFPLYELL